MSVARKEYQFKVSDHYFRLTTECVRLYSNREFVHATISEVVNNRALKAHDLNVHYKPSDLKDHLRIIPTKGDKDLTLAISEVCSSQINKAIPELEDAMGTKIGFAEAVSILLYDLVIEANSTELLSKLGLNAEEAKNYRSILRRKA